MCEIEDSLFLKGLHQSMISRASFGPGVRPEKFQFREKGQNHNFDHKIVISVKNPLLIL